MALRLLLPGEITSDTAATLDDARAEFASAWAVFLANRSSHDPAGSYVHRQHIYAKQGTVG
jgi:hypothetical protein